MDNRIIVFLLTLGGALLSVFVGVALGSGEIFIPSLLLVGIGGLALLGKPQLGAFLVVGLYASRLTAPGLPGQFSLYYAAICSVVGCAVLLIAFKRSPIPEVRLCEKFALAFCTIVFLTGLYQGFGFQFLRSYMWGGFHYVSTIFPALLVFTLPLVNMPATWWRKAIVIMGLLAPMPLLADFLVLQGVNFGILRLFLQTGDTILTLLQEQAIGEGLGRLTSAGVAAQSMVIAFLSIVHTRKLFMIRSAGAIAVLVGLTILSLLSGFRLMTGMLLFVVFLCALYQKSLTPNRVVLGFFLVTVALVILYAISEFLPVSVQRAVSWLPGISVSSGAARDAEGTITWRLDLWREAIHFIPEYFWIGKGFSYDANLYLASVTGYASHDSINWALVTGAYHNGYLSLILLFGVFGILIGLPLLVMVVVRHIRINYSSWNSERLHQCHQAFLASQTCWVLVYLTVYGDVSAVYPQFFFNWAVMEALRRCDLQEAPSYVGNSAPFTGDRELASLE